MAQVAKPAVAIGLSFSALALLFSVMLLGVYITSSHQGLSCPDWPLCPNGFSLPPDKYLFEEIHRIMVIVTASLIFATAVYSARNVKSAQKTAILAAVAASVQIVFGFLVVTFKLPPLMVAAHLSTGITLFAMSLMTFLSTYKSRKPSKRLTL